MLPTPNAASVAIFADGRVLLVARAREPYLGYWTLPGGRLEPGETAVMAAHREIGEELCLALGPLLPVQQLAAGSAKPFILQVFAARFVGGIIRPSAEIAAFAWYEPAELPRLRTTPGLAEIVERARALLEAS